jgi:hypothetical protein
LSSLMPRTLAVIGHERAEIIARAGRELVNHPLTARSTSAHS